MADGHLVHSIGRIINEGTVMSSRGVAFGGITGETVMGNRSRVAFGGTLSEADSR